MKKTNNSDKAQKMRTMGFITGAAVLLAVLTVVICIMAGVFDFDPSEGDSLVVTAPPEDTEAADSAGQTEKPSASPDAEQTPSPTPEEIVWNISVIAGKGGEITPSGLIEVKDGESVTLTITPDAGYALQELKVDGKTVAAAEEYTFSNIRDNHSVYAVFHLAPKEETPPVVTESPTSPTDIG